MVKRDTFNQNTNTKQFNLNDLQQLASTTVFIFLLQKAKALECSLNYVAIFVQFSNYK